MQKVQSLERAFKILYIVAGRSGGRSVAEIAKEAGLKSITAYKLIRTLESESFLKRTGPPLRFELGHAINELKNIGDSQHLLTAASKQLLKAQRQLPQGSFALLQWEDTDTYQRLAVLPHQYGKVIARREYQVDPYNKASSLLFLAYARPEQAKLFYSKHPFQEEKKSSNTLTWSSMKELNHFLKEIRDTGRAQPDSHDNGLYRLAVPVWAADGELLAAAVGFIPHSESSDSQKQRLVELCIRVANRLTKIMSTDEKNEQPSFMS